MPQLSLKFVAALAFAGVSVGEYSQAVAQPSAAGEVTISDKNEPITESQPLPIPGDSSAASAGTMAQGGMVYSDGILPGAPGGWDGSGFVGDGVPIRKGEWYGYQNSGPYWQRPIKRPIYRVPVVYARYWPTSYYTGGYDPMGMYQQPLPMVYQPTDTTQLGFYHQRVPQWLPRPGAIPGPPWPPHWHYTVPVRYGVYYGPNGEVYGSEASLTDSYGYNSSYGSYYPSATYSTQQAPAVIHPEPMKDVPLAPAPMK
jgi:hypothetical protein